MIKALPTPRELLQMTLCSRHLLSRAGITLGLLLTAPFAMASGLVENIAWQTGEKGYAINVTSSGTPLDYQLHSFDEGAHIKVTLLNKALAAPVQPLELPTQSGAPIQSIFISPNAIGPTPVVTIDLFLSQAGSLTFNAKPNGGIFRLSSNVAGLSRTPPAHAAVEMASFTTKIPTQVATEPPAKSRLISVESVNLDHSQAAIELHFEGKVPELRPFVLVDPPQVIIDLPLTDNTTGVDQLKINNPHVISTQVVKEASHLRLIFKLSAPANLQSSPIEQGYRLLLENKPSAITLPSSDLVNRTAIEATIADIDFRRSTEGRGIITIDLQRPNVAINLDQQDNELVIDFINASLDPNDEKRLDVIDFATPVNTIDLFRRDNDVRMVVTARGRYKHSATQTANQYVLEVAPLTPREKQSQKPSTASEFKGDRLSLNFHRIPVRDALQVIADFTQLNIITSDSVSGDLSLILNDVPWDQALDLILQTKGLAMRQKGNVIRVAPANELAAQEQAAFEANKAVGDLEPLVVELIKIHYAKASEIGALLKSVKAVSTGFENNLLGSVTYNQIETEKNNLLSERGSVTVDERTNSILVRDTEHQIRQIQQLIRRLDIPVKQVQIETRIVEATDDFSRSLGARLGVMRVTENAQFPGSSSGNTIGTVYGGGSVESNNSVRTQNQVNYPDNFSVNLPANGLGGEIPSSYAFEIIKVGAGFLNLIDLELSALQAEGKGKIIANPKITTTDKHQAHIEQGQERIFSSGSLLSGGTTTKKAVLGLTVTPQITPNDSIILDVEITNDSFAASDTLNTKQISTQTLLKNGETVIIGGIYQQDQGEQIVKTPILGDIPLLGNLFKKRTKRNNRTELLIFLTPRIIKSDY